MLAGNKAFTSGAAMYMHATHSGTSFTVLTGYIQVSFTLISIPVRLPAIQSTISCHI